MFLAENSEYHKNKSLIIFLLQVTKGSIIIFLLQEFSEPTRDSEELWDISAMSTLPA